MDLLQVFTLLNEEHFQAKLPVCRLIWNSRLRATAGRFGPARYGRDHKDAVIEIASYLQKIENGADHIRDTMLHEMIHYWLWYRGRPYGHTPEFYSKMKETGAKRYNPVPIVQSIKYYYECPSCEQLYPARRKLGIVACTSCCKKHNRGYFHRRFQLFVSDRSPETANRSPSPSAAQPQSQAAEASVSAPAQNNHAAFADEKPDKLPDTLPVKQLIAKLESLRDIVSKTEVRVDLTLR